MTWSENGLNYLFKPLSVQIVYVRLIYCKVVHAYKFGVGIITFTLLFFIFANKCD